MFSEDLPPLMTLIIQVRAAARCGLDLIAIAMACAIPDMCAALAAEDGRSSQSRYKAWCEAHLIGGEFTFVTAEDMYSLRCGVLHQGKIGNLNHNVDRVVFVPAKTIGITNSLFDRAYIYSVVTFCDNICHAAGAWFVAQKDNSVVQTNSAHMMRYHPQGLPPYIVGSPVIA